jgi:hypothetical protein
MHTKIEKCLRINYCVNKEQQRDPTQETIQLIHFEHWKPLHHKKPSNSIKDFPSTNPIINFHQKKQATWEEHISYGFTLLE